MKREIPGVITIHCVIHRHHIAAKHVSGELHDTGLHNQVHQQNLSKVLE